jgi:hypothetical protein
VRGLLALAVLAALLAGPAQAQSEVDALKVEIAAMKQRLAAAEARLERIAQAPAAASATPPAAAPAAVVAAFAAGAPADTKGTSARGASAAVATAGAPEHPSAAAAPRKSWRSLHPGQGTVEVASLLGEPASRFELPGRTVWYYRYPDLGPGSVVFDGAGNVSSWQIPH